MTSCRPHLVLVILFPRDEMVKEKEERRGSSFSIGSCILTMVFILCVRVCVQSFRVNDASSKWKESLALETRQFNGNDGSNISH